MSPHAALPISWPEVHPDIDPPRVLQADTIQIDDFRVSREGEHVIDIRRVRRGLDAREGSLHLEHVVVDSDRGRFTAHGDYVTDDDYTIDRKITSINSRYFCAISMLASS